MNDDNPVSVDVSMAFFAAVLVIFVFVTIQVARITPEDEWPSVGQRVPVAEAVPPTWSVVPERTTFAILSGTTLHVLELDHFARAIDAPLGWVSTRDHGENSSVPKTGAPESFDLKMSTTGENLPTEWIRASIDLSGAERINEENGDTVCTLSKTERDAILRPILTVFVMNLPGTDLSALTKMTGACGYRHRLSPLGRPSSSGRISVRIGLSEEAYSAERIFR